MRSRRGTCPDAGELIRFVENSLPDSGRSPIAEHLLVCGQCANEVRLLRQAESDASSPSQPAEFPRRQQAGERFNRFLERAGGTGNRPFIIPRTRAYVAAVLLVFLIAAAFLCLKQFMFREPRQDAITEVIRLKSTERDLQAGARERIPRPKEEFVGMMFWVPIAESPGVAYACEVRRGEEVLSSLQDIKSFDGIGDFLIAIKTELLATGHEYLLVVTETGGSKRAWQFPFAIGPSEQ